MHSRAAADRFVKRAVGVEPTLNGFAGRRLAAWLCGAGGVCGCPRRGSPSTPWPETYPQSAPALRRGLSGRRESNPQCEFGRLACCHLHHSRAKGKAVRDLNPQPRRPKRRALVSVELTAHVCMKVNGGIRTRVPGVAGRRLCPG